MVRVDTDEQFPAGNFWVSACRKEAPFLSTPSAPMHSHHFCGNLFPVLIPYLQMEGFRNRNAPMKIITAVEALRTARQIRGWMADVPNKP